MIVVCMFLAVVALSMAGIKLVSTWLRMASVFKNHNRRLKSFIVLFAILQVLLMPST